MSDQGQKPQSQQQQVQQQPAQQQQGNNKAPQQQTHQAQNVVPVGTPGPQQQQQPAQQQQQQQQQQQTHAQMQQAPTPMPMAQPMSQTQMAQQVVQPPPVATPGAIPIAAGTPQPMQSQAMMANPAAITNIRNSLPQQVSLSQMQGVQVIQQPIHSPPYIQPAYFNPQLQMLHQVQAMQVGNMNPQMGLAVQGRPPSVGPKSPNMMPAPSSSQVMSQVQMKPPTSASSPTSNSSVKNNSNSKPGTPAPTLQQQSQMMGNKQILQRQSAQPLVIGQVGMIPNQVCSSQQPMMVSQPKSPIVSIAPSSQQPMINGTQQLRFTTQPTFVTNNGQFITGTQPAIINNNQVIGQLQAMAALATHPNMPLGQQQILGTQSPTIIGNQPLYIRTAAPGQIPNQPGIVGTVQPAQPIQQAPITNIQNQQPQQQTQPIQQHLQPIQQQPIKSKADVNSSGGSNTTVTSVRTPTQIQARPVSTAPTQKVVGQAQKVVYSGTKTIAPNNKTPPKGPMPLNQKQPPQKQANSQKPATTSTAHPGYQSMAHVYPSQATSTAKQIVQNINRPVGRPARGRPPKTVTTTQLVNGTVTVSTSQTKTSTSQANQPPPLLVPLGLPSKSQGDIKNEESKGPAPPTLEPVTTKNEVVRKAGPVQANKREHSATLPSKKAAPKPEEVASCKEVVPEKPLGIPAGTTSTVTEKQKAIVKPQILTHMIEGFVIQEGSEPFPVQRSSLLTDFMTPQASQGRAQSESREKEAKREKDGDKEDNDGDERVEEEMDDDADDGGGTSTDQPPSPKHEQSSPVNTVTPSLLKCEFCGKVDKESKFRRSKRFCSVTCSKRYNVGCRLGMFKSRNSSSQQANKNRHRKRPYPPVANRGWKRGMAGRLAISRSPIGLQGTPATDGMEGEDEHSKSSLEETTTTSQEESSDPQSPAPPMQEDAEMLPETPRAPPQQWTVQDVCDFIRSMPDCAAFADAFRQQEIDGQALMLLKEDHLMTAMSMKLGPALKICEKIRKIKGELP